MVGLWLMDNHKHKKPINNQAQIDAIAEQWVHLVFAHLQAKKLATKKPIKINKTYGYATQ